MRNFILLCAIVWLVQTVYSQSGKHRFRVFGIPQYVINTLPPKFDADLKRDLAKATSSQKVFSALSNRLKDFPNVRLQIREELSDSIRYYTYYIGAPKEQAVRITGITATRDLENYTVYKRYQFKMLFTDTLVILDTMQVDIYPTDFNYHINNYFLVAQSDSQTKIALPGNQNTLYINAALFQNDTSYSLYAIFNAREENRTISQFYIRVLSESEKQEITDLYTLLKEDNLQEAETIKQLQAFVKSGFGSIDTKSIRRWLTNNHQL